MAPALVTAAIEVRMTPPKEVWPNSTAAWRVKASAKRKFRYEAYQAAMAAEMLEPFAFGWVREAAAVRMDIEIAWPKGQRRLDEDNAWGACKSLIDGIADRLSDHGDRRFKLGTMTQTWGEGIVTVILRGGDE